MDPTTNHLIFIAGVFLTAALFYLVFYFGFSRKVSYLFFSLCCIGHAGKITFLSEVPYLDFGLIGEAEKWAKLLSFYIGNTAILAFLAYEFSIPYRNQFLLLCIPFLFIIYYTGIPLSSIVTPVAFAFAAYGAYHRMDGSIFSLLGLSGFALLNYLDHEQHVISLGYFLGIIFFMVCMTLAVGRQLAQQNRLRQEALVRSSRLENQMLKKSIQPHFIFNSLASLQELIDQQPRKASLFVDKLADEFRTVSKILGQSLISIEDELAMCRNYLSIMEFRKEAQFGFEVHGFNGEERVPPAIFHTLIENGITHGYGHKTSGKFVLKKTEIQNGVQYTMYNDGECNDLKNANGTGLKYVETRLEENFPGKWKLFSKRLPEGWQVKINIYQV
ncbi:MAG: hypothetical protein DHS20C18_06970 [Saprospiraceae bacterium]|nr:MAG: hypothetical protein DHS20C18_06970 [Saprospiraceae bacterium]